MGRIARSFHLLGVSWQVLRRDQQLLVLPVISFACFFVVILVAAGGLFQSGLLEDASEPGPTHYAALAIVYFIAYFIGIFFNAAIVACAMIRLDGGVPTIRDGIHLAFTKIDKILGWAVVAATVGVVIRSLEERAGLVGRILLTIVDVVWAAVTFFVVPVILFEPLGVGASIKRSASIFRERWGEQLVGNGSISLALFLISLPVAFATVVLIVVMPFVGVAFAVLAFGFLIAAGSAMSGIFNAALYRYAVTGAAGLGFADGDLRHAFAPRPGRFGRKSTRMPNVQEHFGPLLERHAEMQQHTEPVEPEAPVTPQAAQPPVEQTFWDQPPGSSTDDTSR